MNEQHRRKISESLKARWANRTHKHCVRCETTKPLEEFKLRHTSQVMAYCIPCGRAYNAEKARRHYHANPDHREKSNQISRRINLMKHYGITPDCYDKMLAEQGGRCAICRTDKPGDKRKYFSVDHDHATGAVRGLLCNHCNRGLGLLGDTAERLKAAAEYLARHQAANDNNPLK